MIYTHTHTRAFARVDDAGYEKGALKKHPLSFDENHHFLKFVNFLTSFCMTVLLFSNSMNLKAQYINQFEPEILSGLQNEKKFMNEDMKKGMKGKLRSTQTYIIPVVWHVFYKPNLEGHLSEQKIQLTIDTLNSFFAPHNIMFVLAKLDPGGDCTKGITYNQSTSPYGSLTTSVDFANLKSVIHWDNSRYLNIYSVPGMVGSDNNQPDESTNGYAIAIRSVLAGSSFSGFTISTAGNDSNFDPVDGVVVRSSFNRLSLLTAHETGHWLGLFHPWGPDTDVDSARPWWTACHDPNSPENIRNGDFVSDTPRMKNRPYVDNCTTNTCPKFPDENGSDDGNDPRDNIMGNAFPCMTGFTEGQGDVMKSILDNNRAIIHSQQNLIFTGVLLPFIPVTEITDHTTWSTTNLPNNGIVRANSITVYPGALLTINSGVVINMCKNSFIRILPGGRINMYGTTITGQEPEWWQGIQVLGGSPNGFFTSYNNSKIENAKTGILSLNGGRIYCSQTEFKNHVKAVEITSETDLNIYAAFDDCDFNNTYSGFYGFASLTNVNNVFFTKCSFNNQTNGTFENNGIGVLARSAKFEVGYQYDANSECTFSGLDYGVRIESPRSSKLFTVSNSQFSTCTYGIYLLQQNSGKIIYNQFNIGSAPGDAWNNYGIFFRNNSSSVSVQENTFTGQYPFSATASVGVYHDNTGRTNKYVRRNNFNNCEVAGLATLDNANNTVFGAPVREGLRYVCNSYINGKIDIFPETQGIFTVNAEQKNIYWFIDNTNSPPVYLPLNRPTGNTFSGTTSSSLHNNMLLAAIPLRIDYFLRPNQPTEILENPFGVNLIYNPDNLVCNVEEFNTYQQGPNGGGSGGGGFGFAGLSLPSNTASSLESAYQTLAGQQNDVYTALNDPNNHWSQYQVDSLMNIISNFETILDHINHQLTYVYLSDTTTLARENYNIVLGRYDKYATEVELLKELVAQDKWNDADSLIAHILAGYPEHGSDFGLVEEVYELIKYKTELGAQDVLDMKDIADTYDGNGSSWAQSILTEYGYLYHPNPNWTMPRQGSSPQGGPTPQTYREDDIYVYPNPARDVLNVVIQTFDDGTYSYQISDIYGKIITTGSIVRQKSEINTDFLHQGLFILHVTSARGTTKSITFIKQ